MTFDILPTDLVIAQISDCHLLAEKTAFHHDANVYQNLFNVLADIKRNPLVDGIIFTGDLTQDHSELSYQNFVEAVRENQITAPLYYLSGNHDEAALLDKYLSGEPFQSKKTLFSQHWQLLLADTKSATPAGVFNIKHHKSQLSALSKTKHSFLFMHHHPIDVDYFIDKHGLNNKADFWHLVGQTNNIRGIACGHIHRASELHKEVSGEKLSLYTCPATSIQFDPTAETVKSLGLPPSYRLFSFKENGNVTSQIITVNAVS